VWKAIRLCSCSKISDAGRAAFLADGGGCEMQRLGELLDDECWDNLSL
jgi:hypothetical protein